MKVFAWPDRRHVASPRAVMQRGECGDGHCGQFSISISDGERGLTIRFDSEQEFRRFLERGETDDLSSENNGATAESLRRPLASSTSPIDNASCRSSDDMMRDPFDWH